jgi:hypothetical protein
LVNALACHVRDCEFESRPSRHFYEIRTRNIDIEVEKTGLLDDISEIWHNEYSLILEEESKKLIDQYGGYKRETPNIWPGIRRDFFEKHKIGAIVQR